MMVTMMVILILKLFLRQWFNGALQIIKSVKTGALIKNNNKLPSTKKSFWALVVKFVPYTAQDKHANRSAIQGLNLSAFLLAIQNNKK